MKLHDYYTYSWFSNLSYVLWDNGNIGTELTFAPRVEAAFNAKRAPRDLATKIFLEDKWYIPTLGGFEPNDSFGFAANLFVNSKTNEKILAIRGTEFDGVFGEQAIADLYKTDLDILAGFGLALYQAVSLLNYVLRLKGSFNASIPQYVLRITPAGSGGAAPPLGLPFVTLPGVPVTYIWLEAGTSRGGLGLLAPSDKVTVAGHSLGGHLAALALRLFPTLFDQAVTFNAPGFDPFTSSQVTSKVVALFANFLPQTEQPAKDFASLAPRLYSLESESSAPGNDANVVPGWPTNAQVFPNRVQIRTEVNSHSMDQLMDNLALHSLLEDIGGTIDAAAIFAIYDAASRDANDSSERLVAALNKIALGVDLNLAPVAAGNFGYDATDFPNRAAMHTAILAIQAKLAPIAEVGNSIASSGLPDTIYGDLRFSITPWDSSAERNSRSLSDAKCVEVATSTLVGRVSLSPTVSRRRWRESEDHRLRALG